MIDDHTLLAHAYRRRVELKLPNGKQLVAAPLDFEKALEFLDLLDEAEEKKTLGPIRRIAREFPKAIEAGDQLRGLTMVELFDVVRFFTTSRPTTSSSSSDNRAGNVGSSQSPTWSPTMPQPTEDRQTAASPGPSSSSSPESSDAQAPEVFTP